MKPAPAGTPCSDGDACNGDELCDGAGVCSAGAPPTVDDGNPCTVDACNPATGLVHTPIPSGVPCLDSDLCNGAESCDGMGSCAAGVPPAADDGDPCTLDACDPSAGVTHVSCSALDRTAATGLMDATAFLYTGANPVQTGVVSGTLEARRAALIRGQVRRTDGAPLAGVAISVQQHPEYGSTRTLADGSFLLAVSAYT